MKVGILGGSFNPPHKGHIHISDLAIKNLQLDKVWWIPTQQNPFKEANIYEDYVSRVKKCEKLLKSHPKIEIKEFDEIYTEQLVKKLKSKYKTTDFIWLMGADNLENFHKWRNYKKLIDEIPFAIFSREKFLLKIQKTKSWKFLKDKNPKIFFTKNLDISSTKIRKNYE